MWMGPRPIKALVLEWRNGTEEGDTVSLGLHTEVFQTATHIYVYICLYGFCNGEYQKGLHC
jgi:hypothetical protein